MLKFDNPADSSEIQAGAINYAVINDGLRSRVSVRLRKCTTGVNTAIVFELGCRAREADSIVYLGVNRTDSSAMRCLPSDDLPAYRPDC